MRLLDLVEKHDRVGLAAHRLGELAALVVADIAGRRADQSRNGVFFHVFRHVEAHERALAVEMRLGEGLGQLGFADAGGAEKEEAADRTARVLDAGAGAQDGLAHELHAFILTDHAPVQHVAEAQEFFAFTLDQTSHGDAAPLGHDARDLVGGDLLLEQLGLGGRGLEFFQLGFELRDAAVAEFGEFVEVVVALGFFELDARGVELAAHLAHAFDRGFFGLPFGAETGGLFTHVGEFARERFETEFGGVVLFQFQRGLLDLELEHAALKRVERLWSAVHLGADHGAGLVDEVDGLVGQKAVGDVALGERDGGDEGVVLDANAVVKLEALFEPAQDGDGVLGGGRLDQHGLEAALEGGVLLDVFAILVERGRADAVQLAAGEHGLEKIAGVHRALGFARADDGVEFVDEEQDAALGGLHFGQYGLEALLEFAAVFRAGDERTHVERVNDFVLQALGHVAANDALGEALDDGGFAHAGFADEHGVVFRFARENADGAADLVVATDDGVHLALLGLGAEVDAVFGKGVVGGLRLIGGHALVAARGLERGENLGAVEGEGFEVFREGVGLGDLDEAEQQVLGGNEFVLEVFRLGLGAGERVVHRLGDEDLRGVGATRAAGQTLQLALGGELQGGDGEAGLVNERGHYAVFLGK